MPIEKEKSLRLAEKKFATNSMNVKSWSNKYAGKMMGMNRLRLVRGGKCAPDRNSSSGSNRKRKSICCRDAALIGIRERFISRAYRQFVCSFPKNPLSDWVLCWVDDPEEELHLKFLLRRFRQRINIAQSCRIGEQCGTHCRITDPTDSDIMLLPSQRGKIV